MRRLFSAIAALALLSGVAGARAEAGPLRDGFSSPHFSYSPGTGVGSPTIIVGSGNGANNTIGVQNRGGVGNPTIIVNSGNGAANSIGVQNQGGVGNPTVIVGSGNGANNAIGVHNRGGVGNKTIIRDSANGAFNSIDVRNKGFRPLPFGRNGLRHFEHGCRPGFGW